MIKRIFFASFVGALILAAGPGYAQQKQQKPLIVATDTNFVPFEFKQNGVYTGFDIDLWKAIAKRLDLQYTLSPMDFNGIIPALQTNNVDVGLAAVGITEKRRQVIDFSLPYYRSGISVMVRADNTSITKLSDLNGIVIATKTGTTTVDWIKANVKPKELRLFPNIDNVYMELRASNVDAALNDKPSVDYYVKTAGGGAVKVVAYADTGTDYGIAFPKGSPLVAKVNDAIKQMKADGQYQALYDKWFSVAAK